MWLEAAIKWFTVHLTVLWHIRNKTVHTIMSPFFCIKMGTKWAVNKPIFCLSSKHLQQQKSTYFGSYALTHLQTS